jgi:hypothetical protein
MGSEIDRVGRTYSKVEVTFAKEFGAGGVANGVGPSDPNTAEPLQDEARS